MPYIRPKFIAFASCLSSFVTSSSPFSRTRLAVYLWRSFPSLKALIMLVSPTYSAAILSSICEKSAITNRFPSSALKRDLMSLGMFWTFGLELDILPVTAPICLNSGYTLPSLTKELISFSLSRLFLVFLISSISFTSFT